MKLNPKEFKRFKELLAKAKAKSISAAEQAELDELTARKNERGSNDLEWWKNYPELLADVCNIPFNYLSGTPLKIGFKGSVKDYFIPGVAVVHYQEAIGNSNSASDAFNAQMKQLWLDMHRKYRGIGAYQRSDLGMVILAIANCFSTLAKFERIYGVLNSYKIQNRNIPYSLFEGLRVATGTENVLADFRYGLNVRIAKMQSFCLPKGISALTAQFVNNSFIFKDSDNPRANLFLFDPASFAVYDATLLSTGGCVKYKSFSSEEQSATPGGDPALSVTDMFRILDMQIDALLNDDDVAKMCSDLIAAYGTENVMSVNPLPEMYVIEPVHDYERLLQFHNLTIAGLVYGVYDNTLISDTQADGLISTGYPVVIYQKDDVIHCSLSRVSSPLSTPDYGNVSGESIALTSVNEDETAKTNSLVLDTWVDKPGEIEIMCGTRFSTLSDARSSVNIGGVTYYYQKLQAFGTAVVTDLEIITRFASTTFRRDQFHGDDVVEADVSSGKYMYLSAFDWHPKFYFEDSTNEYWICGDIDNPAIIDTQNLSRIHDVALYSGYKVPVVPTIRG